MITVHTVPGQMPQEPNDGKYITLTAYRAEAVKFYEYLQELLSLPYAPLLPTIFDRRLEAVSFFFEYLKVDLKWDTSHQHIIERVTLSVPVKRPLNCITFRERNTYKFNLDFVKHALGHTLLMGYVCVEFDNPIHRNEVQLMDPRFDA